MTSSNHLLAAQNRLSSGECGRRASPSDHCPALMEEIEVVAKTFLADSTLAPSPTQAELITHAFRQIRILDDGQSKWV